MGAPQFGHLIAAAPEGARMGAAGAAGWADVAVARFVPHLMQKTAVSGSSVPHLGQNTSIASGGPVGSPRYLRVLTAAPRNLEPAAVVRREPFPSDRDGASVIAASTYRVAGDPPIVLLHGWPLDRSLWADVASDLVAEGFRVVCPDLPGFGGSPPLDAEDWTVEAYADEVADVLRGIGSGPVPVAGHSFGGYVALALADA